MPKIHAVGIDLGTTYSAVARIDELGQSIMVRNSQGEVLTPSVVLFDDREIVVGKEAKKVAGMVGDRVAEFVKRDMGNPFFSRPIRGEMLPPEVIQSCILRKLKNDIVAELGPDIKVVITVPAYFDEPRRKATHDAGEMAGLEVLDIVNEPTAAALAFGERLGYLDPSGAPKQQMKVLVYDLGGGTFDVTIIDLTPGNIRTLATDGDVRLGGRDWDLRLVGYLAEEFRRQHGLEMRQDVAAEARLGRIAEDIKHTLSARDHATAHVEFNGRSTDVTVTRKKFEELNEDLLERTSYTCRQVLGAANLQWRDISHVLLVGGSTRMPSVREMLEKLTGLAPDPTVHPDEAVARGAAVYANYQLAARNLTGSPPKFRVTDVNAHALGIEGIDQRTLRKENVILIKRNTSLPYRVTEKFVTKSAGQSSIVVRVLEGDSKLPDECSPIARAVMRNLPKDLPKNWPVEVTYEYGTNSRLSVRANVPGTDRAVHIELEREKGLSDDRLARWKQILSSDQGFDAFESMLEDVLQSGGVVPGTTSNPPTRMTNYPAADSAPPVAPGLKPATPPAMSAPPLAPKPTTAPTKPTAPNPFSPAANTKPPVATNPTASATAPPKPAAAPKPAKPAEKPKPAGSTLSVDDNSSGAGMIFTVMGHIVAITVGLVVGYYILCLIAPQANFLNLNLPGLPAVESIGGQPPPGAPQP